MPPALLNESNVRMLSDLSYAFAVNKRVLWVCRIAGRNVGIRLRETAEILPDDLQAPIYAFCKLDPASNILKGTAFSALRNFSKFSSSKWIKIDTPLSRYAFSTSLLTSNLLMNEHLRYFSYALSFLFFSLILPSLFLFSSLLSSLRASMRSIKRSFANRCTGNTWDDW